MRQCRRLLIAALLFYITQGLADTPLAPPKAAMLVANLKGVNLSGAELNGGLASKLGYQYSYPTAKEIDYYAASGFGVIRLPFDLTRTYPMPYASLAPVQVAQIKAVVDHALTKGMRVILDPAGFGYITDTRQASKSRLVGRDVEGTKLLADFWSRMATVFRNYPNVIFGLMNEPHDQTAQEWHAGALRSIAAIRGTGATQMILIPGTNWAAAYSWATLNGPIWAGFRDPNFAYEVHQYLDSDSSGTHQLCVLDQGAKPLVSVTAWAKSQGVRLFLGEFGWSQDPSCSAEANAFMTYLSENNDIWAGWTYWAGGPWWAPDYMFLLDPANAVDKPQMSVLKRHLQLPAK